MELGEVYDKGVRPRRHSIAAEGLLGEMKYNVNAQARHSHYSLSGTHAPMYQQGKRRVGATKASTSMR